MRCARCGYRLSAFESDCPVCTRSERAASSWVCSVCGARNPLDTRTCRQCGAAQQRGAAMPAQLLGHNAVAAMRPLERVARLQAAVGGGGLSVLNMTIAGDILATCTLSRRHALPVYQRLLCGQGEATADTAPRDINGGALAVAQAAAWALTTAQMVGYATP